MAYLYLTIAVISEVIATLSLKASEEFTKLLPSIIVIVGYGISFYFLTLCLRTIPVGITYALWSAFGIVIVAIGGRVIYDQVLDLPAIVGMTLIIIGVVTINVFQRRRSFDRYVAVRKQLPARFLSPSQFLNRTLGRVRVRFQHLFESTTSAPRPKYEKSRPQFFWNRDLCLSVLVQRIL